MSELSKRGLVAAAIVSVPFQKLGSSQARTFGVPELPLIVIPHPLGGISIEQVEGRAQHALPKIIELAKANSR